MKRFIQLAVLVSLLATPFTGYCNYYKQAKESELGQVYCSADYVKSLLIMDLISKTSSHTKKKQLKTQLEVYLLYIMDDMLDDIEYFEQQIIHYEQARKDAKTIEEIKGCDDSIILFQEYVEKLQWAYEEIKALLAHTR